MYFPLLIQWIDKYNFLLKQLEAQAASRPTRCAQGHNNLAIPDLLRSIMTRRMTRRLAHDIQVTERDVQSCHIVGDKDTKLSKNSKEGYWV